MHKGKIAMLSLLILLFALIGSASAQTVPVFCGNLAEADCTLLTESQQATMGLTSASISFEARLGLSNIPGMPAPMDFSVTGSGAFAVTDPAIMEQMANMSMEMAGNPTKVFEAMSQAIKALSGELTLNVKLPAAAMAMSGDPNMPSEIPLEMRLVDGIGYLNFDTLAPLNTTGSDMPTGWQGIDLAGLMTMMSSQMAAMSGSMPTMDPTMFTNPDYMGKFVTIERLADSTDASGQPVAVFQTSVDLGALYADPDIQQMMLQQMQGQPGMDEAVQQQMQAMMPMLAQMFQGFVIEATQSIGITDKYVHASTATFNWSFDPSMFMPSGSSDSTAQPSGPINISFDFSSQASDFNNVQPITAPEGATIVPLESLMGGGMSGSSG